MTTRSKVEIKSVGVDVVFEIDGDDLGVGLPEVDTARIDKAMGCDLTAVSVGEGGAPVRIDGDDAGESKEYGLDSDHYACWLRISRVQHEILVSAYLGIVLLLVVRLNTESVVCGWGFEEGT